MAKVIELGIICSNTLFKFNRTTQTMKTPIYSWGY
jgi:hypothetical protein